MTIRISNNSVFGDEELFSKNREKIITKKFAGTPSVPALPPIKLGAKRLLDNQDCALKDFRKVFY